MPTHASRPRARKGAAQREGTGTPTGMEQERVTSPRGTKRAHLVARVTDEQKMLFERAAALRNQPLSQFLIATLQREAEHVIREHDVITLSARDSRAFMQALLDPEPASQRLHRAAERYKAVMGDR